jgi:hypothetical protein
LVTLEQIILHYLDVKRFSFVSSCFAYSLTLMVLLGAFFWPLVFMSIFLRWLPSVLATKYH